MREHTAGELTLKANSWLTMLKTCTVGYSRLSNSLSADLTVRGYSHGSSETDRLE